MMNIFKQVFDRITASYSNDAISTGIILAVLFMVLVLSIYEFIIYRIVSHRSFYNRSFIISTAVLPFFIASIILCLQSNLVITLGTIGALAIIRYRTAIKDPVDMLYILWSIHTGIICGCQLYEVGVLTSLIVTVVLILLEHLNFGRKPYVLILNTKTDAEDRITNILKSCSKSFKIKSRTYNQGKISYAIELTVSDPHLLGQKLNELEAVEQFSIVQFDSEDIL